MNNRALTQLTALTWTLVVLGALLLGGGIWGSMESSPSSINFAWGVIIAMLGGAMLSTGTIVGAISLHAHSRISE